MEKYQESHGERFVRDNRTNYFYSIARYGEKNSRKAMHRRIWELENGKIPDNMHVHHKDGDRCNNDIKNLELLSPSEHMKRHNEKWRNDQELIEKKRNNLKNNVLPKAVEWHKSEEGRKWHSEQYEKTKDRLHATEKLSCIQCHTSFDGKKNKYKFCSNKCKSKWRRESGLDDEIRQCVFCSKSFEINRYSKTITCSRSCSSKKKWSDRETAK